jgi:hypothetical protein
LKAETPDDLWLELCGKNGWVAFSHDDKFHSIEVEAAAIRQHSVAAFTIWGAQLPTWDKLCTFVRAFPKIRGIVRNEKPPYLYRLRPNARLYKVRLP